MTFCQRAVRKSTGIVTPACHSFARGSDAKSAGAWLRVIYHIGLSGGGGGELLWFVGEPWRWRQLGAVEIFCNQRAVLSYAGEPRIALVREYTMLGKRRRVRVAGGAAAVLLAG